MEVFTVHFTSGRQPRGLTLTLQDASVSVAIIGNRPDCPERIAAVS